MVLNIITLSTIAQNHTIEFKPTDFYNNFSHKNPIALKIQPGDTVKSESVDAGGFNKYGERVAKRGNPLTGPFYIEGAQQGDVVAITLLGVSLNRGYATTVEGFVKRCLPMDFMKEVYGRNAKSVKWTVDTLSGYAKPETTHEHLANFKIRLHPFLGCLGVAAFNKEPLTYFAGEYGGNMDFYKVTTGATVYLPVFHQGALLYLGDGHAAQGDGEINGDALETSMNFSFVVSVIKAKLKFPRLEDSEHLVCLAMEDTIELALKQATHGLIEWLQEKYNLSLKEASQVIGTCIEYRIPTLAGPKLEVAAMIKKELLQNLRK